MQNFSTRRDFLRTSAVAALAIGGGALLPRARAIDKLPRSGAPRLMLSLAAYSFRDFFKDNKTAKKPAAADAKQIDLFDFVNFCGDHDCAAEVTSYYFPAT